MTSPAAEAEPSPSWQRLQQRLAGAFRLRMGCSEYRIQPKLPG